MFNIRKAQLEDCKKIHELRNDLSIRKTSFNPDEIPYESHVQWFSGSLLNPDRKLFVVEDNELVGVVRFDLNSDHTEALVSVFVSPQALGRGIGSFAIVEGERLCKHEVPSLKTLHARVMADNIASLKLFEKCHYAKNVIEFSKEVL